MKKLIAILIMSVAFMASTSAQTAFSHTHTNPTGAVVNTGSDTMFLPITQSSNVHGIQIVVTKVSGTVAGSSILAGTVDGTNYINTDTMTLSNVARIQTILVKTSPVYTKYRIITTGTGTMSAIASAAGVGRKYY